MVVYQNTSKSRFNVSAERMHTFGLSFDRTADPYSVVSAFRPVSSGTARCGTHAIAPGQKLYCVAPYVPWSGDRQYILQFLQSVADLYANGVRYVYDSSPEILAS